jgi:hypothetical protein
MIQLTDAIDQNPILSLRCRASAAGRELGEKFSKAYTKVCSNGQGLYSAVRYPPNKKLLLCRKLLTGERSQIEFNEVVPTD